MALLFVALESSEYELSDATYALYYLSVDGLKVCPIFGTTFITAQIIKPLRACMFLCSPCCAHLL